MEQKILYIVPILLIHWFDSCASEKVKTCIYPDVKLHPDIKNAVIGRLQEWGKISYKAYYTVDEEEEVHCLSGYEQRGPEIKTIKCGEGGNWSHLPKCEPLFSCTNPDITAHGKVHQINAMPHTKSTFECDTGFNPTTKEAVCTYVEGTPGWKLITTCEPERRISEPKPQLLPILHGYGTLIGNPKKIRYTCYDGYEYIGSENYILDDNGQIIIPHTESFPVCEALQEYMPLWMKIVVGISGMCVVVAVFLLVREKLRNNKGYKKLKSIKDVKIESPVDKNKVQSTENMSTCIKMESNESETETQAYSDSNMQKNSATINIKVESTDDKMVSTVDKDNVQSSADKDNVQSTENTSTCIKMESTESETETQAYSDSNMQENSATINIKVESTDDKMVSTVDKDNVQSSADKDNVQSAENTSTCIKMESTESETETQAYSDSNMQENSATINIKVESTDDKMVSTVDKDNVQSSADKDNVQSTENTSTCIKMESTESETETQAYSDSNMQENSATINIKVESTDDKMVSTVEKDNVHSSENNIKTEFSEDILTENETENLSGIDSNMQETNSTVNNKIESTDDKLPKSETENPCDRDSHGQENSSTINDKVESTFDKMETTVDKDKESDTESKTENPSDITSYTQETSSTINDQVTHSVAETSSSDEKNYQSAGYPEEKQRIKKALKQKKLAESELDRCSSASVEAYPKVHQVKLKLDNNTIPVVEADILNTPHQQPPTPQPQPSLPDPLDCIHSARPYRSQSLGIGYGAPGGKTGAKTKIMSYSSRGLPARPVSPVVSVRDQNFNTWNHLPTNRHKPQPSQVNMNSTATTALTETTNSAGPFFGLRQTTNPTEPPTGKIGQTVNTGAYGGPDRHAAPGKFNQFEKLGLDVPKHQGPLGHAATDYDMGSDLQHPDQQLFPTSRSSTALDVANHAPTHRSHPPPWCAGNGPGPSAHRLQASVASPSTAQGHTNRYHSYIGSPSNRLEPRDVIHDGEERKALLAHTKSNQNPNKKMRRNGSKMYVSAEEETNCSDTDQDI